MYNIEEKSIIDLSTDLAKGKVTSVELVKAYIKRIAMYDSLNLNSVLEINPDALFIAQKCDVMRKEGTAEGILFGIPVMIKDNIDTCDKMHTSAGSLALKNNYAREDSGVAELLRESGAIILGKTNMTEFANYMTEKMPSGYSSRGGYVINPYARALPPSGSSSGSAVAAACSFAAACIGTETNGSIVSPSKNNCIVGIKPTVGLVSRKGIIPISHTQDTAGTMTRSVEDGAILLTAIAGMDHDGEEATLSIPGDKLDINYFEYIGKSAKGLRIGYDENAAMTEDERYSLRLAIETLSKAEAVLVPVDFNYKNNPHNNKMVMSHEFKSGINRYLAATDCEMKSLRDIIRYNNEHSAECLKYGQTILNECETLSGRLCEGEYLEALLENTESSQGAIDKVIDENRLDVFMQSCYNSVHAVSGYPCISVPTDVPCAKGAKSIFFIGKKWSEGTLITVAHAFEKGSKKRVPPQLFSFQKAKEEDVSKVYGLIERVKKLSSNDWDETYPTRDFVEYDYINGNLYVYKNEMGEIIGTIALDTDKESEHEDLIWAKGKRAVTLSRLCIDEKYQWTIVNKVDTKMCEQAVN